MQHLAGVTGIYSANSCFVAGNEFDQEMVWTLKSICPVRLSCSVFSESADDGNRRKMWASSLVCAVYRDYRGMHDVMECQHRALWRHVSVVESDTSKGDLFWSLQFWRKLPSLSFYGLNLSVTVMFTWKRCACWTLWPQQPLQHHVAC